MVREGGPSTTRGAGLTKVVGARPEPVLGRAKPDPWAGHDTVKRQCRTRSSYYPYFANSGVFTSTFRFLNAGMTSFAKRSNCSSATASGTPTDRLIEIRSRPG